MNKLNFKKKINILNPDKVSEYKLDNKSINLIDVNYNPKKAFEKISKKSNRYITNCFKIAFKLIKKYKINKLINGPINKKTFLNKNYLGITEYISKNFNVKGNAMLIYNKKLSVCPLTTHLPINLVAKNINKELIFKKTKLINLFYKKILNTKPKIGVVGLNPHCESINKFNEDDEIIKPAINTLKKMKYNISGPYPADTIFLKKKQKKI